MATKTKTAGSTTSAPEKTLEGLFSEALDLVDQKAYDKALVALEALRLEAGKQGQISMARSARNYIAALQLRTQVKAVTPTDPELAAQLLLNCGAADEALALLDKAIKTDGQDARLFYLKATAHAQKDEAEAAAEAIRQSVALNQDVVHQFRLERDFDRVRSSAPFLALGLE
jgi:tetratricopeptide (TPR) repeat protein